MIKKVLLFSFMLCISSCKKEDDNNMTPTSDDSGLMENQSIITDGVQRDYHLYVPSDHVGKPLVILLHGNGSNFDEVVGNTIVTSPQKKWLTLAEQEQFFVLVPNGSIGSGSNRGWNDCRRDAIGNPISDDVLFMTNLLDEIATSYSYDVNRVYVAGISNGGHMAIRLSMEMSDKIAAFAAVVASMPQNSQCWDSDEPISALFMNGTADPILPYLGGDMASNRGAVFSADESIAYWTARNGTATDPVVSPIDNIDSQDNCQVTKFTYADGTGNTEVELYSVIEGGHTEPSLTERYSDFYLGFVGNQNGDMEMADQIWEFFEDKMKE